jgi:tellurite methyltransferase
MKNTYPTLTHSLGYYEATKESEPSVLLLKAVQLLTPDQTVALDLGCGAGRDTRYLSGQGLAVTALDADPVAEQYVMHPLSENAHFIHTDFESFAFGSYDLINASMSLPFLRPDAFEGILQKIKSSLKPRGIFVGSFLGPYDEWNKPGTRMTFIDKHGIEDYFTDLDILALGELEQDGVTALGTSKHWHFVTCIAQKPMLGTAPSGD